MGKPWHPECFRCTQCAIPLGPNNFYEKNGKPYCEDDYHKLFSPKCAGCHQPITDVSILYNWVYFNLKFFFFFLKTWKNLTFVSQIIVLRKYDIIFRAAKSQLWESNGIHSASNALNVQCHWDRTTFTKRMVNLIVKTIIISCFLRNARVVIHRSLM
jgi:hypothetical protein